MKRTLANAYFFDPSPSVRRVVTIGTPHRGSQFANSATRWLGHKLITLPAHMLQGRQQLLATNRDFFRPNSPIEIATSIDSLAPDSPILPVLLAAQPGPWTSYYNVVGREPDLGWRGWFTEDGDGVVSLESARLDNMPQLAEQIVVHRITSTSIGIRKAFSRSAGYCSSNWPSWRTSPATTQQSQPRLTSYAETERRSIRARSGAGEPACFVMSLLS